LRKEKAAGAPRQSEYRYFPRIAAGAGNRAVHGSEDLAGAQVSYGSFKSVDALQAIKGTGSKRLEKMRKYLTLGKPAPSNKTQKSTATKPPPASQSPAPADDEEEQ
jgi:hypothetical protein